jgi:hypothetical protein
VTLLERRGRGMIMIQVPEIPENERIESMCMRYDHVHGIKLMVLNENFEEDAHFREETDGEFSRRQEFNRSIMRQLYEEATGQGFFRAVPK